MRVSDDITTHPLHRENLSTVQALITNLRNSQSVTDLANLQEDLYKAIKKAEARRDKAKSLASVYKNRQNSVVLQANQRGKNVDRSVLWDLQQNEKVHVLEIDVFKHICLQLRTVGDGLLWKATGYNRGYIGAMSSAAGGGNLHLSEPEGLAQERRIIEQCGQKGILAVHHDLTTCAKVGDFTLIYPSGKVATVEVKKSGKANHKQSARLARVSQISSGELVTSKTDPAQIMRSSSDTPKHHLDKYCEVLVEAGMKGYAFRKVNDFVSVSAFNLLHSRWDVIRDAQASDQQREDLYRQILEPGLNSVLDSARRSESSVGVFDSTEKVYVDEARSGAPWAIYPFSPDVCAYLTCGYLRFLVYIDFEALFKRFSLAGFQVEIVSNQRVKRPNLLGEQQVFPVIKVWRPKVLKDGTFGSRFVLLGRAALQQLLFEGLHVDTLIESLRPIFRDRLQVDNGLVFNHLRYLKDGSTWKSLYLHPAQIQANIDKDLITYSWSKPTIISTEVQS